MTTLTLTLDSVPTAEAIAATLRDRGFAAADVAVFGGATEAEDDEAALAERLGGWALAPEDAAEKAARIAGGAVLVAVRVTDEDREVALAILEGRGADPVNDARAGDEAAADLDDLDGQSTRLASSQ